MLYFCCLKKKKEIDKDIRLERIKILPFYREKRQKIIENFYNK